jgi:tRNA A-37 threonylcarbamoyl transferase component Bud32
MVDWSKLILVLCLTSSAVYAQQPCDPSCKGTTSDGESFDLSALMGQDFTSDDTNYNLRVCDTLATQCSDSTKPLMSVTTTVTEDDCIGLGVYAQTTSCSWTVNTNQEGNRVVQLFMDNGNIYINDHTRVTVLFTCPSESTNYGNLIPDSWDAEYNYGTNTGTYSFDTCAACDGGCKTCDEGACCPQYNDGTNCCDPYSINSSSYECCEYYDSCDTCGVGNVLSWGAAGCVELSGLVIFGFIFIYCCICKKFCNTWNKWFVLQLFSLILFISSYVYVVTTLYMLSQQNSSTAAQILLSLPGVSVLFSMWMRPLNNNITAIIAHSDLFPIFMSILNIVLISVCTFIPNTSQISHSLVLLYAFARYFCFKRVDLDTDQTPLLPNSVNATGSNYGSYRSIQETKTGYAKETGYSEQKYGTFFTQSYSGSTGTMHFYCTRCSVNHEYITLMKQHIQNKHKYAFAQYLLKEKEKKKENKPKQENKKKEEEEARKKIIEYYGREFNLGFTRSVQDGRYYCKSCPRHFRAIVLAKDHYNKKHSKVDENPEEKDENVFYTQETTTNGIRFFCTQCPANYEYFTLMKLHLKEQHKIINLDSVVEKNTIVDLDAVVEKNKQNLKIEKEQAKQEAKTTAARESSKNKMIEQDEELCKMIYYQDERYHCMKCPRHFKYTTLAKDHYNKKHKKVVPPAMINEKEHHDAIAKAKAEAEIETRRKVEQEYAEKIIAAAGVATKAAAVATKKAEQKFNNRIKRTHTEQWDINNRDLIIGKQIGQGSFGVVFKGTLFGEDVAIKQIAAGASQRDIRYASKMLDNEVRTLSRCRHKNIVQLKGKCSFPHPMLVMAYASRGDLRQLLDEDCNENLPMRLSSAQKISLIRGICDGMAVLHSRNILHLDLKPQNVLISGDGTPWIADFGLAKAKSAMTSVASTNGGSKRGTLQYKAPELFRPKSKGGSRYEKPADVYSFAMLCWEVFSGDVPFGGQPENEISTMHMSVFYGEIPERPPVEHMTPHEAVEFVGKYI